VLRDLDSVSREEKEIFGYLLAHNERSFSGAFDGGYANTLIAKGLIVYGGGTATDQDCAFVIPFRLEGPPAPQKRVSETDRRYVPLA
jgi:hypothetical protein